MDSSKWPVARQVDYRLIGSAIARVRWEIEITRAWQSNPLFYKDQTIGAYFSLLLPPPPFDAARTRWILNTLASFPKTLQDAKSNLSQPVAPFASLTVDLLKGVRPALLESVVNSSRCWTKTTRGISTPPPKRRSLPLRAIATGWFNICREWRPKLP